MRRAAFALALGAWSFISACSSSGDSYTYEHPPAGIIDTPYWFTVQDTLFWYAPYDSLGILQVTQESSEEGRTAALRAAREMGWRMTVNRSAGLTRGEDPQALTQTLYALERVGEAASPILQYDRFQDAFWSGKDTVVTGLLPGMRLKGEGPPQYFWPSELIVVWKPGLREPQVRALIDSLALKVSTPMALAQYYYVERAWAIDIPPGKDVFTWVRWFNKDPRVSIAYPVSSTREPASPDQRWTRRFPPRPDTLEPEGVNKLPPLLKSAWEIATFSGHAGFVEENTGLAVLPDRIRVRLLGSPTELKAVIDSAGGCEVVETKPDFIEVWVPYQILPDLASNSAVKGVLEVKPNLLES